MRVKFNSTKEAKSFVSDMCKLHCDINLADGHQIFDAKSILGIMGLDLTKTFEVWCVSADLGEVEKFNEIIKKYVD